MIRNAKVEDILEIVHLEQTVFHESLGETFLFDEITLNPFSRMFVIEDETGFAGFIGLRVDEQAELMNFAVVPKKQNKGYGKALLRFIIELLKNEGISFLTLEVRKSNVIAQKLYESFGFKRSHIRKDYYKNEDAYVYIKEVNE